MTSSLLPAPRLDADAEAYLTALTRERILVPAEHAGFGLPVFGASVLPQKQTIVRTQHRSWLFVDNRVDPSAFAYDGQIPLPRVQRTRLASLARAGVCPDHLWLAHELPDDWNGGELPALVPPPPALRRQDDFLLGKARGYVRAIGEALTEAATAVGSLSSSGIGLDPIVLGGVQHPSLPVVSWVVLAQWDWE